MVFRVICGTPYSSLLRCHLSWVLVIILVIQASLISAHEEANLRNCRRSTNDFVVSLIMLFGRIFVKTLQMLMIILRGNLDSFVVWSQSQGHRHPPSWWPSPRPGFCTPRNLGTEKSIKQVILWRQIRTIVLASNHEQCSQLTMFSTQLFSRLKVHSSWGQAPHIIMQKWC